VLAAVKDKRRVHDNADVQQARLMRVHDERRGTAAMTMKPCLHRTRVCRSRWWWWCDGIRDAYGVKYHRYMAIIGLVNLPDYSGASPPLRAFLFASTPCQQLRQGSVQTLGVETLLGSSGNLV
jgi:hypothetical protein